MPFSFKSSVCYLQFWKCESLMSCKCILDLCTWCTLVWLFDNVEWFLHPCFHALLFLYIHNFWSLYYFHSFTGKKNGCRMGRNCWRWRPTAAVVPHSFHFAGNTSRGEKKTPLLFFSCCISFHSNESKRCKWDLKVY